MLEVEVALLKKCETIFENFLHDFKNVCPRRSDETPGATTRSHALGKVVEEGRATFNTEVRVKLLECGLKLE